MLKTRLAKEVIVRMENEIGTLDGLAKAIAERGVNVLAVCAWVEGAQAVIRVLTDDSVRVLDALRGLQYEAREMDVLVTEAPHKPGMLHRITATLAQGELDIHHLYATATSAQNECLVVFATANNDRALVLLNARSTGD
jgi:hypothetical protein